MKNTIACCYLTHNHPDVIKQVLGYICEPYGRLGIDIYIYDSSPADATQNIVRGYQNEGFANLFYVDVRCLDTADEKYLYIIQGKGLTHKYDYIWPTKDRCFFVGESLKRIVDAADRGRDVIFCINEEARWELLIPPIKTVYYNPVEFFAHYGQLTTDWEGVIRRTDTMSDGVDWEKFILENRLEGHNHFNQTIALFARLAELSSPKIEIVHYELSEKKYSAFAKSEWRNEIFEIWIDGFIPAIKGLPSIYDEYKQTVIKAQLGCPTLFGSNDSLISLKKEGLLTSNNADKLHANWTEITDLQPYCLDYIMNDEFNLLYNEVAEEFFGAIETQDLEKAYIMFGANRWLGRAIDGETYATIETLLKQYGEAINRIN